MSNQVSSNVSKDGSPIKGIYGIEGTQIKLKMDITPRTVWEESKINIDKIKANKDKSNQSPIQHSNTYRLMSRESINYQGTTSDRSNKNIGMVPSDNSSFIPLTPVSVKRERLSRLNKNLLMAKESRNEAPEFHSFLTKEIDFGKTQPNLNNVLIEVNQEYPNERSIADHLTIVDQNDKNSVNFMRTTESNFTEKFKAPFIENTRKFLTRIPNKAVFKDNHTESKLLLLTFEVQIGAKIYQQNFNFDEIPQAILPSMKISKSI